MPSRSLSFFNDFTQFVVDGLIILGALGDRDAELEILVDGGELTRLRGLHRSLTMASRTVDLLVTDSLSPSLADPEKWTQVLDSIGLMLAEDLLSGPHRITVINRSEGPLQLRAATETLGEGDDEEPERIRWIRAEEVGQ